MTTVVHVCPVFAGVARRLLNEAGRADVEVRALQGGPEAAACRPTRADTHGTVETVLGGPCVVEADGMHRLQPAWSGCFEAVLSADQINEHLDRGGHLLAAAMMHGERPIWHSWGFREPDEVARYVRDAISHFLYVALPGEDAEDAQRAADLAATFGVPLERHTGEKDRFASLLRLAVTEAEAAGEVRRWRERVARDQLAFDLIGSLDRYQTLGAALEAVQEVLGGIFGGTVAIEIAREGRALLSRTGPQLGGGDPTTEIASDGRGFSTELHAGRRRCGTIVVCDIALPDHVRDYVNLATSIAPLLAIAIERFQQRATAEQRQRLSRAVFEAVQEGLVVTDPDSTIQAVNPAFERITGYSERDAVGANPRILKSGRHDAAFYAEMWASLKRTGAWSGELFNQRKDGTIYRQRLQISSVRDEHGAIAYYVGTFADVTDEYAARRALERQASHDPLTGLGNRDWLASKLVRAIAEARDQDRYVGAIFVDLDRFKAINDTLGHAAGDAVLTEIAERLRQATRRDDGVARVGGDEFVVVAAALAQPEDAMAVAEKLLATVAVPVAFGDGQVDVSVSLGVALYPTDAAEPSALLHAADVAMYRAKQTGRNRVVRWS